MNWQPSRGACTVSLTTHITCRQIEGARIVGPRGGTDPTARRGVESMIPPALTDDQLRVVLDYAGFVPRRLRNKYSVTATRDARIMAAAALQGFAAAAILVLVLALPPLLSPPDDVHRVTAAMFTISYSCAVIVPVISGLIWDLSGIPSMAFLPIALCGLLLVILAPAINHIPRVEH